MTICGITSAGTAAALPAVDISRENYRAVRIPRDADFTDIQRVIADPFGEIAGAEDEGYLVIPRGSGSPDYGLFFLDRAGEDFVRETCGSDMPVFGVHTASRTFLAVVSGMSRSCTLTVVRKNGRYRIYPVFGLYGNAPEEDILVEYFFLTGEDADYSGMARRFRQIRIERYGMRPLRERAKEAPALKYAAESVMICVRCAACDFERVGELLDELKRQGVGKAEICLTGRCGEADGEKNRCALTAKAQAIGYRITCRTDHTEPYGIADCCAEDNICGGLIHKSIPFRQLVCHGYELPAPCPSTVNSTARDKKAVLRLIEYGGRPSFCLRFGSKGGSARMEEQELCITTDGELADAAARIREGDDILRAMDAVTYSAICSHKELSPGVYEILYENGTHILVNYNSESCEILI